MGFILLRWGTIGKPWLKDQNAYEYVLNSPINNEDPWGLSVWSTCKNFCKDFWKGTKDTAKEKAKEKLKDIVNDKMKEWFADHIGGESVEQAKKECDAVDKGCQSDMPGWAGFCADCAIYRCALNSVTAAAADTCLKAKLTGCDAGIAP